MAPEEIAAQYGHLTLAQVHAALAYYYANRQEIEADLSNEAAEYQRLSSALLPFAGCAPVTLV